MASRLRNRRTFRGCVDDIRLRGHICGGGVLRIGRNRVGAKGSAKGSKGGGLGDEVGEWLKAPQFRKMVEAVEIAAHAKTAIAGEVSVRVEHRQSRQFHRQAAATVD